MIDLQIDFASIRINNFTDMVLRKKEDIMIFDEIIFTPEHRKATDWFKAAVKYKFNETIKQSKANQFIIQKLSFGKITQSDNMDIIIKEWWKKHQKKMGWKDKEDYRGEDVKEYRICINHQYLTINSVKTT